MIFVDTSAALALANPKDDYHETSIKTFQTLLDNGEELLIHNYAIVETIALLQRRVGLDAAAEFERNSRNLLRLHWITEADHERAVQRWIESGTRRLNLVDCMSFIVMEMHECDTAFTYDSDFETEGFKLVG